MKVKVLLFGNSDACNQLRMYLRDDEILVVGNISNENQVLDEINRSSPDIILVADTSPMALRACNQIYLLRPRSIPVIITENQDAELLQKIVQTGVHHILSSRIDSMELISELKAIYSNEINRIMSLESTGVGSSKSRVVLVFGPKDGVGKTTLAVNLAIKLAQNKNSVALLDYNMQFGDVAAYMGILSKDTIVELLQEQANPNVDTIRQFLALHVSGVNVLPAPFNPEDGKIVSAYQAEQIIAALRVYYDYVIVDSSAGFDDITAGCMECASTILLVSGSDVPALRNTKKSLAIMRVLTEPEKIKLVVSRQMDNSVKNSDISRVLGVPVWRTIPEESKLAMDAANQGNPIASALTRSKIVKEISKMVQEMDGKDLSAEVDDKAKKGFDIRKVIRRK